MFSNLRSHFGTAGLIVAVVALVAALGGGAYAASGGLSGKQKKETEKIAKKYAGKPGAAGPQGPAGPAGAKGDAGSAGAPGTAGAAGPTGTTGPTGQTGFTATLPSKKTETGSWAGNIQEAGFAPISFNIPLAAPLDPEHAKVVTGTPPAECENSEHAGTASGSNPEAKPGYLCIYVQAFLNGGSIVEVFQPGSNALGAGTMGSMLTLESTGADSGWGTFAVTAP